MRDQAGLGYEYHICFVVLEMKTFHVCKMYPSTTAVVMRRGTQRTMHELRSREKLDIQAREC